MALVTSGTQTATISTKHQLYTTSTDGIYALGVDTSAMALGDVLEIYAEADFESAGTNRQVLFYTYAHVQADPGKVSIPVIAPFGVTFHLKQTAGTGRAFPWFVVSV